MANSDGENQPESLGEVAPKPDDAAAETPPEFLDRLRELLDHGATEQSAARIIQLARFFSGPLPPAEMLSAYERIQPGLAARIIGWTEAQQTHRHKLETEITLGSETRQTRGQVLGFLIALGGILAATFVGILGHWAASSAIILCTVGGTAGVSVVNRWLDRLDPSSGGSASSRER